MVSILIAEDHKLLRESWSFLLKMVPGFLVIAESGNGIDAVEKAKLLKPDVAVLDINLPGINGFKATTLIRKYSLNTKIVAVSMHSHPVYVRKIIQCGALGYVSKYSSSDEFIRAIEQVHSNKKFICSSMQGILSEPPGINVSGINSLTYRELEIISWIKTGNSSKEIARNLKIAVNTVEIHRHHILKKLQLKNVAELVNYLNKVSFDDTWNNVI